jgi:FixJ family two-component response regulator
MAAAVNDATVLVVDDDAQVRRGISRLVRAAGYTVKTFPSPQQFLRESLPAGPACVLLDMRMDGMSGLEVQEALRQDARDVPIVFLSGHGTVPIATRGMKQGARDFLEKPVHPRILIEAIERAIDHDRTLDKDRQERHELRQRYDSLTTREREVMRLVTTGLLNKQAAANLGISEKTIKVHRARVMQKMRVDSLAELVRIAERLGIDATVEPGAPTELTFQPLAS